MATMQGSRDSSRRRRSERRSSVPRLHDPRVGKVILAVMIAITLAHVGATLYRLRKASQVYGWLAPGMTREETRYLLGRPEARTSASNRLGGTPDDANADATGPWIYRSGSAITTLLFDDARQTLASVACSDPQLSAYGCPQTMGLSLGTGEDAIWYRLGAPSRSGYQGETKVIVYDELGLSFWLRKFQTVRIKLAQPSGKNAYLARLPRVLVP